MARRPRPHPSFAVGDRVTVISAPRWKGCTFEQIGKDGVVVAIQGNTPRLDYVIVEIERYHHNFTPYELRHVDPVRALASLAEVERRT